MPLLASTAYVLDQDYIDTLAGDVLPGLGFAPGGVECTEAEVLDTGEWLLWQQGFALIREGERVSLWTMEGPRRPTQGRLLGDVLDQADDLPSGLLRQRLERLIGAEALWSVAGVAIKRQRFLHRNAASKIDCRAMIASTSVDETAALPPLLVVEALRGYAGDARMVLGKLTEGLASAPPPQERLRVWLHAAGNPPGEPHDGTADLEGSMPAAAGIALSLRQALTQMAARAPMVVTGHEIEHLHKYRVAIRRARALLKAVGGALSPDSAKRGAKTLRWLGRLSTPVRDLDVLLAGDGRNFSPALQGALKAKRERAQDRLAEALVSQKYRRFMADWPAELAGGHTAEPLLRPVADAAILLAARRFVNAADALGERSPPEDLHELRKLGKQLRYLLDYFRALYPPKAIKALIRALKKAQNALGAYQDLTAHSELLAEYSEAASYLAGLATQEPARRADAMQALAGFRAADALAPYMALTGSDVAGEIAL